MVSLYGIEGLGYRVPGIGFAKYSKNDMALRIVGIAALDL